ncbi:class I adenylate-forming enzyme family protein [Mesorhizobium sp. 1B3]|uniref:class I adenylate-forming enzyme family protein n=1 Tax=Mesorhizobium sp. 1B3 TaxID=3243599 RepID=UPI003D992AA4
MTIDPGIAEMKAAQDKIAAMAFPTSIGAFVAERAATMGDASAAIWFEDNITLSYADLHRRSDTLAAALMARGIRKGAHVALMMPNVPEFVLSWFALAKLGAVLVPTNSAYTSTELDYLLNQSDAQAVIIDASLLPALEGMSKRPAVLDDARVFVRGAADSRYGSLDAMLAEERPWNAPWPVVSTDLMSLQYTSGTTGFPKGCMLTHDYWLLLALSAAAGMGADEIKRSLLWAPFFYMDPQWQLLMTMQLGGTAYIAKRLSLSRFFDWVREFEINYTSFSEVALKALPPSPADKQMALRYINAWGWAPASVEEAEERFNVIARDSFGMTEIGAGILMPVSATHKLDKRTCGVPAPFRETRIIGEDGRECGVGEAGELQIRGRSILLGYYKRPDANAESFEGDWFRTGDLFTVDEDGYYSIVGRIKDMVRRSAENISAREVEAVLHDMPEIEEAAVVPVPDPLRKEEVKAYIKLKPGVSRESFSLDALFEHCRKNLAAFKVPRYVAFIDEYPRTPSDKIAKSKLIAATDDLRMDSFDRVDGIWR